MDAVPGMTSVPGKAAAPSDELLGGEKSAPDCIFVTDCDAVVAVVMSGVISGASVPLRGIDDLDS